MEKMAKEVIQSCSHKKAKGDFVKTIWKENV